MSTDKKKIFLPGEHLGSYEEGEPGENTFSQNDEIFSLSLGEREDKGGKIQIKSSGRKVEQPKMNMEVYCAVIKTTLNNAICDCISSNEAQGKGRGVKFTAVLPVTEIRRGYVEDLRNEVKTGDIIKARIIKTTRTGYEISISPQGLGVVRAFCPKCRDPMALKGDIFICNCGWKERRKLTTSQSENEGGFSRNHGDFRSAPGRFENRNPSAGNREYRNSNNTTTSNDYRRNSNEQRQNYQKRERQY
ncbi:exosome complex RNA-binding protein Csl4 [Candidatus Micrarchaeota archaeon]|nr:exosome complex RNA-binding protein Csl4 [Candidatus Micrarchaeota archaeon]